jgi:Na+/melibiose symporter-like transporter
MAAKPKLDPDQMLQAEYDYIGKNVFQSNEDRSRFSSYYFVTVGSFAAAILGSQFDGQQKGISLAFFLLFLVLTFMGSFTLAQLARLRAAWHEAVEAMNKIKEYYIEHNPEIAPAFKWRPRNVPPTNKPYSIANLIAMEVSMLSSLTTGAGIYFLMNFLGNINLIGWVIVVMSAAICYIAQWTWYKHLLVDDQ